MAAPSNTSAYVATYVRIRTRHGKTTFDTSTPDSLAIYLGGPPRQTIAEADADARHIANQTTPYSCLLPRVFPIHDGGTLIDTLYEAAEWFEKLQMRMQDAVEVLDHNESIRR
jgi:hypothetical protein